LEFADQTTIVFVTMCVEKRRPLLARPEVVALLLDCWRLADHWRVGRWVAMPDHLHLFCAPAFLPHFPSVLGALLAQSSHAALAASRRKPHLAA
jgi:REP element-mobilizing transposase RayT